MMPTVHWPALLLLFSLPWPGRPGDDPFFVDKVVPILRERCVICHNPQKNRGKLDMTRRAELLNGGARGPAVVPGNSGASRLYKMVSGPEPEMPKQGPRLAAAEVETLRKWIDAGAPWPEQFTLSEPRKKPLVGADWWSLRPLTLPHVPVVRNRSWVRTPIDAFILAALEARGLNPAPEADKRTLIRRVSFDLHGLPPTVEEVGSFLADDSPGAYERLVDRLLASPRYGERWGRHWLDVVHYGDTHGYDKDKRRDHAWPYRDYVIRALNQDTPYGRFIHQQLAGDVLYPDTFDGLVATGFLAAGPWDFVGHVELREGTVEKEKTRLLDRDDMVANTFSTFQSLTVHCARCHDHKFDPVTRRNYYRLQAVFAGIDRGDRTFPAAFTQKSRLPGSTLGVAFAVLPHAPRPICLLNRGDLQQPGAMVGPGTLECVAGLGEELDLAHPEEEGARRAALAQWLASPKNVLTWRSIVNRVWHYHFGRGIVDTPNDFGWNGGRPSHPEFLDWLAIEFRDGGQSLKQLHRLIVLSATYRQSSRSNPEQARIDGDNRYLWHMSRSRLEAEEIRDSVLAVSGTLYSTMGGPGFELFRFKDDHSPAYDHSALEKINDPNSWRRTVYRFTVRSVPNPFLECLDCADPNINTPVRSATLTALQALVLLNDPFIIEQAKRFAERLEKISPRRERQIEAACELAFSRPPRRDEAEALAGYARRFGLANLCRLLVNTNEFVFVD